jgi:hypothetical protein
MIRSFLIAATAVALFAHCGGAVEAAPPCPGQLPSTCTAGDVCASETSNNCGQAVSVDCHCGGDKWTCDQPPSCKEECPNTGASQGQSCSTKGATCASNEPQPGCFGGPPSGDSCFCDGTQWQCPIIDCPPPPPPPNSCPAPSQVVQGHACAVGGRTCPSTEMYYDCNGDPIGTIDCTCYALDAYAGHWECMDVGPPNCADAGPPIDAGWADAGWKD